jgi:hypothetical protein
VGLKLNNVTVPDTKRKIETDRKRGAERTVRRKLNYYSTCNLILNEEFHNLYFSPNTIRMIKSRRMRLERHVA